MDLLKTLFEIIAWHFFVTGDTGGGGSTELATNSDKGKGVPNCSKVICSLVTPFLNGP